jgi:hypothetical protein
VTPCAWCGAMLMIGFAQVPSGYMVLCGDCKKTHDASKPQPKNHTLVECFCSCGARFDSLEALLKHASEMGGLLHGD